MPFGVDLPENLGTTETADSAPAESKEVTAAPEGSDASREVSETKGPQKPASLVDLDKLERFRFEGKEWNRKDLRNAYLRHEDYTRKTQELSETRKYVDNFASDLRTVMREPQRLDEFRKIYPKQFIEYAEEVLRQAGKVPTQEKPNQNDPYAERFAKVEQSLSKWEQAQSKWEQAQTETQVAQIESWLENQFSTLSQKYPYANPEVVTARTEVASKQGHEITQEVLDKLFRANDEEQKAHFDSVYKSKITKQIETGKKGKDVGTGGGIPGAAPRGIKTLKDAKKAMLEDFGVR